MLTNTQKEKQAFRGMEWERGKMAFSWLFNRKNIMKKKNPLISNAVTALHKAQIQEYYCEYLRLSSFSDISAISHLFQYHKDNPRWLINTTHVNSRLECKWANPFQPSQFCFYYSIY